MGNMEGHHGKLHIILYNEDDYTLGSGYQRKVWLSGLCAQAHGHGGARGSKCPPWVAGYHSFATLRIFLQFFIVPLSLQPRRDLLKFWMRSALAFATYKKIQSFPAYIYI